MVIDTSALVALLFEEPDGTLLIQKVGPRGDIY